MRCSSSAPKLANKSPAIALRYYKEHRELAATGKLSRPAFKCGAPENARAWRALVDEFFAGLNRTGECK